MDFNSAHIYGGASACKLECQNFLSTIYHKRRSGSYVFDTENLNMQPEFHENSLKSCKNILKLHIFGPK